MRFLLLGLFWRALIVLCSLGSLSALAESDQSSSADLWSRLYSSIYIEAGVGWNYANSIDLDSSDASIDFDAGVYDFTGALGTKIGDGWRVELGWQGARNTPEILFGRQAELELDSDELDFLKTRSLMVSVLRDLKIGQAFRPYVGVGVGRASVDLRFSEASVNGLFIQRPRRDIVNDKDAAFAYQFIAGVTVPVTPWLDLAADYRYLGVPSVDLVESDGSALTTSHGLQSAWFRVRLHAPEANDQPVRRRNADAPQKGLYLAVLGGGGFSEDSGRENELTIDAFDPGPTFSVAVGYQASPRVRIELEGAYRRNNVEVIELGPDIGEDAASGEVRAFSLLANAYYVFRPDALVRPFIGLGAGFVRAEFDIDVFGFCANFVCGALREEPFLDTSDTQATFQVMAGVEAAISSRLKFTADYRYFNSLEMSASRTNMDVFRGTLRNTSVVMGLRYSL